MSKTTKQGDCEASHLNGGGINVEIFQAHHNMWLCKECLDAELVAIERSVKVVEHARKVDSLVELKQDLFKAGTVPFVEISAAIQQNPSIPAEEKGIRILEEVDARIKKLSQVIFEEDAKQTARRNEKHALLVNAQNLAATLHSKDREKFKQFDVNYKPAVRRQDKPSKPQIVTTKKFNKKELYDAVAKYPGVPAAAIQGYVVQKNVSCEVAAKELAQRMGLI